MAATQQDLQQQRRLYAELWISFVALIRSYVAAHDLARPVSSHALVTDDDEGRLILRSGHKSFALEFDATTGKGSWTIYADDTGLERVLERGRFGIGEDSRLLLSDRAGKLEMEVAAEAFTAKVFDEG